MMVHNEFIQWRTSSKIEMSFNIGSMSPICSFQLLNTPSFVLFSVWRFPVDNVDEAKYTITKV